MQEQVIPRQGGAAFIWKWGAIAGVVLGVLEILFSLLTLGLVGSLINFILWLAAFFVVGLFASRQTGRVGTGALTGLVTGLVSGLLDVLFGIIQIAANGPQITQALNNAQQQAQQQGETISSSELHTIVIVGVIVGLIFSVAIQLGLGAGVGALGGLVGRTQAKSAVAPAPYAEAMWTPPPPPPGAGTPQE